MDPDPNRPFLEADLAPDPVAQFERWFADAKANDVFEPEAAALATATHAGAPSARMVLVKQVDRRGLTFFTNYASRKGEELIENPRAALLFHWPELGRQVRAEGEVEQVGREESERYARSRSRSSQLSALASPQSRRVPDRDWLERRKAELEGEHAAADPLPVHEDWGGYRLTAVAWEFWQQRRDRLHDRFRFEVQPAGSWRVDRLAP